MAGTAKKGGKKNRKFGRHTRNPSSAQYTLAKRWVTNKTKAMKRHARRMAKKSLRRIDWEIRTRRTSLQAAAAEIERLRHVVSQNHTG